MWNAPPEPKPTLQPQEVACRNGAGWVHRAGPFRLRWVMEGISAQDGVAVAVELSAAIEVLPDAAELTLFGETFADNPVTEEHVRQYLQPPLRAAAGRVAGESAAELLVSESGEASLAEPLRTAMETAAFGCGLRVHAPVIVRVTSAEFDRRRRERAHRAQTEQLARDRLAAVRQSAVFLNEWHALHRQSPELSPAALLHRLTPTDQAAAVNDALASTEQHPARFWAVAGRALVRLDWLDRPADPIAIELPDTLGPLRCVRVAGDRLLIGARQGVWVLRSSDGSVVRCLVDPNQLGEHGFSDVVEVGPTLWATHREAGLVGWATDSDEPTIRVGIESLGGRPAVPHHWLRGGELGAAVDHQLLRINPSGVPKVRWTAPAPIVAVLGDQSSAHTVCANGNVACFDVDGELRHVRPTLPHVTGACRVPWLWSHRLLLRGSDGVLHCVGLEDDIVSQFASPMELGRSFSAAGGKVIAMTADRTSVVGWTIAQGRQVAHVWNVLSLTHARITDVAGG